MIVTSQLNNLRGQIHVKNLITDVNKKYASRELLNFINSIYREKCGTFTKWEALKEKLSAFLLNIFFEKI